MIMDVNDSFSLEKKAAMDRANPKVLEWEASMAELPGRPGGSRPGAPLDTRWRRSSTSSKQ